ncbi:uncharacterized protein BXZ73DRAFT_37594 [Epithele typhae]|uniref:uncharacterized protein n=1 Tax=Epithele typhae TaxID=378194 RepID=UPI0020089514|nr:uncharacterized protein BXZ73DRAFT_37594 [Epithele typhae]KAH9946150.1 hypothetical protein BXZ73DRAFT_37594 [Epithele typhae]
MFARQASIRDAYEDLGIEEGASLEAVKTAYRQAGLALKTHPDKNPGDADATAQFQKVSAAYNTLVKHLDRSEPQRHSHTHEYGFNQGDYYDDDVDDYDYFDDDDYYDEYESDFEDHLDFYRFLFEEIMRGRSSRFAHAQFTRAHPHHPSHRPPSPPESEEQYAARLRRQREEQERAAERRAEEEAARKAEQEREREQDRREAEQRKRDRASTKKAEAAASRRTAEQKMRSQQEQAQIKRSEVFAAARRGDFATVKKGVWEDDVDAAGGEIRKGFEDFIQTPPGDRAETLLHIAAKHGNVDIVEWLDSHSADPEERNSNDMTVFHAALQNGHSNVLKHLFEAYEPNENKGIYRSPKHISNLRIALDSKVPEVVWMVLDKHLFTDDDISEAWRIANDKKFQNGVKSTSKHEELVNLLDSFGKFSLSKPVSEALPSPSSNPPPSSSTRPQVNGKPHRSRPTVVVEDLRSHTASPSSAASDATHSPSGANGSRGRGKNPYRGSFRPYNQQGSAPSSPSSTSPFTGSFQQGTPPFSPSRGRGRGRFSTFRGHGRGRGRGNPAA